ncbi:hypothetical protein [Pseudohongiella nitratireducens]|uniref:hypothetical protein n=1 Tax=Pseudohongiella nitratireducens TaxID=1768907 RepID=UPI00240A92BA|nr:hypothetical protein [Pseudohongiella nitratireducens]|tara:strand:- start:12083 stop:13183 length:1101 start_codon:yes stop_codon:yes gene_type:complete
MKRGTAMTYQWLRSSRNAIALTTFMLSSAVAAQVPPGQAALDDLQRSAEVFSATLTESLGLNERQGIFSPRNGHVNGRYLARQGMVFEIVMPDPGRSGMTGINLQQLDESLSALSQQLGTMVERGLVHRPDPEAIREAMALSLRSGEVAEFYREKLQDVSALSESVNVERALARASATLQRLQADGVLNSEEMSEAREHLDELQQEALSNLQSLRELQQEIRREGLEAVELPDSAQVESWESALSGMTASLAGVESRAREQLSELQAQQQRLRAQNQQARQQALASFESRLFETVCDYAAAMRALPDQEYVTLILAGAGRVGDAAEENEALPRDRVHVLTRDAIVQCRQGEMNGQELADSASTYNY